LAKFTVDLNSLQLFSYRIQKDKQFLPLMQNILLFKKLILFAPLGKSTVNFGR
jgi:hypothetical protein